MCRYNEHKFSFLTFQDDLDYLLTIGLLNVKNLAQYLSESTTIFMRTITACLYFQIYHSLDSP